MKIRRIGYQAAYDFLSQFPKLKESKTWPKVLKMDREGKKLPLLCLGVFEGKELVGVFSGSYLSDMDAHVSFLEAYRGEYAVTAAKRAIAILKAAGFDKKILGRPQSKEERVFASLVGFKKINGTYEFVE